MRKSLVLLALVPLIGCAQFGTVVDGALDYARTLSAASVNFKLGPVALGVGYDGNGGVSASVDVLDLACALFKRGCPPPVPLR